MNNFLRILKRHRFRESLQMQKVLKSIIKKFNYVEIDRILQENGFEKDKENTFFSKLVGVYETSTCLACVHKKANIHKIELSVYSDINGLKDEYVILLLYGMFKGKRLVNILFGGEYHKTVSARQKDNVPAILTNLVLRGDNV